MIYLLNYFYVQNYKIIRLKKVMSYQTKEMSLQQKEMSFQQKVLSIYYFFNK